MAYETHYVGDLRAINYAILDQYQVGARTAESVL
jgi:hypothetical protein